MIILPKDEYECPYCELHDEYYAYFQMAGTNEELSNLVRSLISDAGDIRVRDYVEQEIADKIDYVNSLVCNCEDSEE